MRKTLIILILLLRGIVYSTEFSSVRASGMGYAFSAIDGDVGSLYHNPAGIRSFTHSELNLDFGAYKLSDNYNVLYGMAFVWPGLYSGSIPMGVYAKKANYDSASVQSAGLAFSGNTGKSAGMFSWGLVLKSVGNYASGAQSYLADAGFLKKWNNDKISVGMSLKNIFSGGGRSIDFTPSLGVGYEYFYGILCAEISYISEKARLFTGIEREFYEGLMVLRTGFCDLDSSYVTFGLSSYLWPIGFDTSFQFPIDTENTSLFSQFSLKYRFGGRHFSEIYLDRSIEKSVFLDKKIRELKEERAGLSNLLSKENKIKKLPGIDKNAEKDIKKPLPAVEDIGKGREKEPVLQKRKLPDTWPKYHKVIAGDNLRAISNKYYGNSNKWQIIYDMNSGKIERGLPKAGEVLVIPRP